MKLSLVVISLDCTPLTACSYIFSQSELSELTTLADERQWLAQVLTKQLVREEDRNKHLAAQLGNALNRVPLSDDDDETKHK